MRIRRALPRHGCTCVQPTNYTVHLVRRRGLTVKLLVASETEEGAPVLTRPNFPGCETRQGQSAEYGTQHTNRRLRMLAQEETRGRRDSEKEQTKAITNDNKPINSETTREGTRSHGDVEMQFQVLVLESNTVRLQHSAGSSGATLGVFDV